MAPYLTIDRGIVRVHTTDEALPRPLTLPEAEACARLLSWERQRAALEVILQITETGDIPRNIQQLAREALAAYPISPATTSASARPSA